MHILTRFLLLLLLLPFSFLCGGQEFARCPSLTHIRCSDGLTCIRKSWMCDGNIDCPDHSDELTHICLKRPKQNHLRLEEISTGLKCPPSWFKCHDGSSCLHPKKVCDKFKDCRDGSDELEICNQPLRSPNTTVVY
uniref:Uncharacterized protein n=1 Tax=Caenorhabditis japonica TaxID=281687 RepID=A0A8R1DV89_CAEJA